MEKQISQVTEFRKAFNIGIGDKPRYLTKEASELHYKLLLEELDEYKEATNDNDIVEIADAIGDILYLALGCAIDHGLQHKIEEVFSEIQRSNMSKLDLDGNPIYREDGKILKGINYTKPNLSKILKIHS